MKFVADFHVHSKYSRATAKNLDLENLYIAGQLKGITVVGTGDFTHPDWFFEIKSKLEPVEGGLFKLKDDIEKACDVFVPAICRRTVRFILSSEISNIYKKKEKTRKNHNLVFVPDLKTAEKFNAKLDRVGNIKSDGRPILGLDARDLLEILLETSEEGFLVPAHIWTPWFSVLGSKSGFDSIKACFDDLTDHIFAVETGLSSDPPMNWQVNCLNGLTLISNSDAHSPMKLGREANIFQTQLSFSAIKDAIRTGDPEKFLGTYEFYPEEGKYHLDGHRKCKFSSAPEQTRAFKGVCPVCGNPMTLGVLYRVEQLADRSEKQKSKNRHPYYSIIPLDEVLSELMDVGPNSKKVKQAFQRLLETYGAELEILYTIPLESFQKTEGSVFREAIRRIRRGKIEITPGYDGEFGKIRIFSSEEKEQLLGQKQLFAVRRTVLKTSQKSNSVPIKLDSPPKERLENGDNHCFNSEQLAAVYHQKGPIMVTAGPGTGKTWTITHRIAHLLNKKNIDPHSILAVTFTNKAAKEMADRIKKRLHHHSSLPYITTFHAFCLSFLEENTPQGGVDLIGEKERFYYIQEARKIVEKDTGKISCRSNALMDFVIQKKQSILKAKQNTHQAAFTSLAAEQPQKKDPLWHTEGESVFSIYQDLLKMQRLVDFEDLINGVVNLLENDVRLRHQYQQRYAYIFVDEYQDVNQGQYRIIKYLAPSGKDICVIGDPNQSIYAFRGSNVRYFKSFIQDYPDAVGIRLSKNYRSTQLILDAAQQMIQSQHGNTIQDRLLSQTKKGKKIQIIECEDEKSEAVYIGKKIEQLTGGFGFHSIDFGRIDFEEGSAEIGFSDFAVLFRTAKQAEIIAEVFYKAGIPFQRVSKEESSVEPTVAAIISILKLTEKKGSFIDFERVAAVWKPGISVATMERWKRWAFTKRFSFEQAMEKTRKIPIKPLKREQQLKFDLFYREIRKLSADLHMLSIKKKIIKIIEQGRIVSKDRSNQKKMDMIQAFIRLSEAYDDDTERFFKQISLQSDVDTYQEKAHKVALMTIHSAKGLEFPVVFVIGCEDGFHPHHRAKGEVETAEEKRLLYVAMTRAKQQLYISFCRYRTVFGKRQQREASPFLRAIDRRLIEFSSSNKEKSKRHQQLRLFSK